MVREDTWLPHELVLALDLYLECGDLNRAQPETIEVSRVLRTMAVADGNRPANFRSPSSVASKLANFKSLDPRVIGGRPNAGDRDRLIWRKFAERPEERRQVADALRVLAAVLAG